MTLEAVVLIRLNAEVEVEVVTDLSASGDLAGMTDNRGTGRHAGHAFVVNRRDDVEAADRALRGVGVMSRNREYLGWTTGNEGGYSARRVCAVTPVDTRCVMAGAGRWGRIGGIGLRSARIGESRQGLRASVYEDVG